MGRTPVMDANSLIPEGKDGIGNPSPAEENIIDGATELKNNGDRKSDQIVPLPGIRLLVHSSMVGVTRLLHLSPLSGLFLKSLFTTQ